MNSQFNYEQGYFCDIQGAPQNASMLFQNLNVEEDDFWSQNCEDLKSIINKKLDKSQKLYKYQQKCLKDTADQDSEDQYGQKIQHKSQKVNTQKNRSSQSNCIRCSANKIKKRSQVMKGQKDDTLSLNRNIKSIILKFCNEGIFLNKYNQHQRTILKEFKSQNSASFKLLKKLIQQQSSQLSWPNQDQLKKSIFQLFKSSKIVHYIMLSKSLFHEKIRLLKFIEIARKNLSYNNEVIKWKDNFDNKCNLVDQIKVKSSLKKFQIKSNPTSQASRNIRQIQMISIYLEH